MQITARKRQVLLLLPFCLLLALVACAPNAAKSASVPGNVPSGTGTNPEPGTDGSAQPAPSGHTESIVATADLAFVGSDNQNVYALGVKDGKVRWHYKTGDTTLVYVVANGVVYVTAQDRLYALNTSNGALLWKYQAQALLSQVQVSAGVVYAATAATGNTSTLVALDATTGALHWHYTLQTSMPGLLGIVGNTVYMVQIAGDLGAPGAAQTIHALGASDGQQLWQAAVDSADGIANGVPVADAGMVYFATSYGALYAFAAATGQPRWHVAQTGLQPMAPVALSPVISDGLVYVGNNQAISAYRATDGARQWRYSWANQAPFPAQPVLVDGVVYAGNAGGQIVAVRASDGKLLWQQRQAGVSVEPVVVSDGLVINDTGPVFALRASDGKLLWQGSVSPSGVGSAAGKPEAVSAGVVYIGGDNGMVTALHASDGKPLWQYAIQELPVQTSPVYQAVVTFAPTLSYQQALEMVTNLGLKTFVQCHAEWVAGDEHDAFAGEHALLVAATVNSAPLWLGRLKATQGVTDVQARDGVIPCLAFPPGNGPQYLPPEQAGAVVLVTFTSAISYATALDSLNALGFRMADSCYEQARAQGQKPTWHPMGEADAFARTHALVLATTQYNAVTWAEQVKRVAGFASMDVSYQATC
jgi:outer membrane protein assembly factor BamB